MNRETLSYNADGLSMKSELIFDTGTAARPGVLVFPEAFGLNQHAIRRAELLASLGYVVLAADLHGNATTIENLGIAVKMLDKLYADPSKTRARAAGALKALTERPEVDPTRTGAIGFCFGGTMGLELARSGANVRATVGFHSGLATVALATDARNIKGKVLVCIGADDPFIPLQERTQFETEMRGGGVDWEMNVYGNTKHSFTNPQAANVHLPDAVQYNPEADRRSWAAMQLLFAEVFKS